jgi:DNA modification methylase
MNPEVHCCDCLDWFRDPANAGVRPDLVYLDPPFCAQRNFGDFDDRWPSLDEYLEYLLVRIQAAWQQLSYTGSLWLHCDQHASHYLKVAMDVTLGRASFRNEVVWRYRRWPTQARQLQRMHDTLFWYSRQPADYTFRVLHEPLAQSTLATFGTRRQRADFSSGHRKPGCEELESPGAALSDVWEIPVIAPSSSERTGYATQKPEALLERILAVSSNRGDLVLDPMCGSGTALAVALRMGRRAIGLDRNPDAVRISQERLNAHADKSAQQEMF